MAHSKMAKHQEHQLNTKNLQISVWLNITIAIAEVVGGLLANSLSLLSDALHNLGDGLALLFAYVANRIGKKDATHQKTFGFKRMEILSAFINSMVLVGISVYLFVEAFKRFFNPQEVDGTVMLIVAVIGLLANVISVLILHKDSAHNLNIKAAYLHLIGDTLSSVAVIGGGLLIYFYELHWIDPLVTIIIGVYILKEAVSIVKETMDILMQGTPKSLSLTKVKKAIEKMPGIKNIHHVHTWALNEQQFHFEAHVDLEEDIKVSESTKMQEEIENMLNEKFGIDHVTLQFEHDACGEKDFVNNHKK
ncbi:MAG: cation diffusion facilitator family transporter [Bacteroidota bacterium]